MTNSNAATEREYFAMFAKRVGMYIGRTTLHGVTGFIDGYAEAARRHGGSGLDGWRAWLMANHQVAGNLAWTAQVKQIALSAEEYDAARVTELTPEQEARVLEVLFSLLDRFLAERENAR